MLGGYKINPNDFRLFFGGKELDNNKELWFYNICNKNVIQMMTNNIEIISNKNINNQKIKMMYKKEQEKEKNGINPSDKSQNLFGVPQSENNLSINAVDLQETFVENNNKEKDIDKKESKNQKNEITNESNKKEKIKSSKEDES